MWALTGGKSDITTSLGAVSFNWSQGEFGFLGKKGNSAMENFGYALGAFSNLLDMGKVGSALLQTEKGGLGHSAVTTERGDQIIDFGPDKTRGGLAKAVHNPNGASKWYSRVFSGAPATNRYGFEGATPMAISKVNLSTLKAYGKFLDFMTSKGVLGAKMPYSFLYSSCSVQAGIGLLLGGIPNIAITPWLLEQSVRMWNAGLTPSMVSNSYQFQY
jgi:hypothetical protein